MEEPEIIVFDLDFTLWDGGGTRVDCTSPPYTKVGTYKVVDSSGREICLYPDVPEILKQLSNEGMTLGIASRTAQPMWVRQVLDLLDIHKFFDFEEIFPDSKLIHFRDISGNSRIGYRDMLFFDDEPRNIQEVGNLGVTSILVSKGMNRATLLSGIDAWNQANSVYCECA